METISGSGSESPPESESPRQASIPTLRPAKGDLPPMSPLSPGSSRRDQWGKRESSPQAYPYSQTPINLGRVYPVTRWFVLAFAIVIAVYAGGRLLWSQDHTRLSLSFGPGLELRNDSAMYGLDDGYRLVELNGVPVGNPGAIPEILDESTPKEARLRFEKHEGARLVAREVIWLERPAFPDIRPSADGSFSLGPGTDPAQFGLAPGERIVSVNGLAPGELVEEKIAGIRDTGIRRLTVQPANADIPPHDVVVCRVQWKMLWTRFAFGLILGFLGIIAFWRRPETRSSLGFLVYSLTIGFLILAGAAPHQYRFDLENSVFLFLQVLAPAATLFFVLTFTPLRLVAPRPGIAVIPMLGVGAALFAANLAFFPGEALTGSLGRPLLWVQVALQGVLLFCALCADWLVAAMGVSPGATDRQRSAILRLAMIAGLLPVAAFFTGSYFFPIGDYRPLFELAVLVCPAMIAFAIERHRSLDIGDLVREAAPYLLLAVLVPAAYATAATLLLPALDFLIPLDMTWAKLVLVAVIAPAALLVRVRVRDHLQLRYRRVPANYESLLESFSEKAAVERLPQAFCEMAAKELCRITNTLDVAIVTRYPGDERWNLAAISQAPSTGRIIEAVGPLLSLLQINRREIYRDDLIDDVRYGEVRWTALAAMEALHASVVFPMMIHDRMIGVISFGDKAEARNFPGEELRALRRVTRHMGFTLWGMVDTLLSRRNTRIVDLYPGWPATIGRWTITGFLGKGGMSYVYHGHDGEVEAALKVANGTVQASVTLLERFHREALAMKRIDHPNIIRVHEVAHADGEPYIALEYFSGGSLRDMVRARGPLGESSVLDYARQTVRGLNAAYKHGVIHRDVKPRNLFLSGDGVLKVGDFGLARMEDISTITSVGDVLGTPDYMSPEVARGDRVDWRADQYALGITMYELLAGKRPFKAERMDALIFQYITAVVPDIRKERPEVSAETAHLIVRMIAKDPEKRFQSYEELLDAIAHAIGTLG